MVHCFIPLFCTSIADWRFPVPFPLLALYLHRTDEHFAPPQYTVSSPCSARLLQIDPSLALPLFLHLCSGVAPLWPFPCSAPLLQIVPSCGPSLPRCMKTWIGSPLLCPSNLRHQSTRWTFKPFSHLLTHGALGCWYWISWILLSL